MSRRIAPGRRIDAAIVGGGIVGAACALALAREGLQVTLIERAEPAPWSADAPDPRVYAFAPDSAALLDAVGVWDAVAAARAQPYRRMCVWDAGGGEALRFDADALAVKQLGWIVENALPQDRLWAALRAATVTVRCPAAVVAQPARGARRQDGCLERGRLEHGFLEHGCLEKAGHRDLRRSGGPSVRPTRGRVACRKSGAGAGRLAGRPGPRPISPSARSGRRRRWRSRRSPRRCARSCARTA